MNLIDAALGRSRTVMLTMALILVAGVAGYFQIPKESDPDVTIPTVYVLMKHEGIAPEDAERLLQIPRQDGQQFGVMLNLRIHPQMQRIKGLLDGGQLGDIQRVQWTITNWFRSEAYYASSEWRATWKGEGGGVLINQALHNLDLLQWFCGMPKSLQAYCRFGNDHDIELPPSGVGHQPIQCPGRRQHS